MAQKPANLIYGLDDRPPFPTLLLLGIQHIFLMSSTLVLPIVLVNEIGGSFREVCAVVALTMIACGLGTIIQTLRWGGIGSGFVCPNLCGPNFFMVSMDAAWLGGLPLMRGMTIIAGLAEAVFARLVHRLKFMFPSEITGLVVLLVALELIPLGVSKFMGINFEGEPINLSGVMVAAATLLVMVGVNIWGRGRLRLYSVLAGMLAGYTLAWFAGLIAPEQFRHVANSDWIAAPFLDNTFKLTFRWSLVPVFCIVSITGALKSFGNLIMCEKVNDSDWREPDLQRIAGGLTADAICVTASGLLGGVASDTSASNVALSSASGATSRAIGYTAGAMFILLAFFPKISGILSIMPAPVMGAILVFVTCFMIASGLQIIVDAGLEFRKTFAIGIALIFGLSVQMMPELYAELPLALRPLFSSALTLGTLLAVLLNLVFRASAPHSKTARAD